MGTVLVIVVLGVLFVLWVISLFLVLGDSMGLGAKVLWLLLLTVLAPIAIPTYFILRRRRLASA